MSIITARATAAGTVTLLASPDNDPVSLSPPAARNLARALDLAASQAWELADEALHQKLMMLDDPTSKICRQLQETGEDPENAARIVRETRIELARLCGPSKLEDDMETAALSPKAQPPLPPTAEPEESALLRAFETLSRRFEGVERRLDDLERT